MAKKEEYVWLLDDASWRGGGPRLKKGEPFSSQDFPPKVIEEYSSPVVDP